MVIKVYLSSISGNMEIKKQQDFVLQILQSNQIEFEKIDITDPSKEEEKMFMRENSVPKDGKKIPLPPQIFNDIDYCGDFEGLHEANECDDVLFFLKLAAEAKQVSQAELQLEKEEEAVRPSGEAEEHTPPPQQSTVVVSTLTLGSLSSGGAARGEDDPPPPEVPERAPVDRTESDDGEQAVPISPRGARKSRDMHNYENVEFSAAADDKAGDEQYPTNDDDEVLSCDSIEGDDHRSGDADKEAEAVQDAAEQ